MSRERELLKRTLNFILPDEYENDESLDYALLLYAQISDLLAQPEQEPVAWILKEKETGYKTQVAYRPSVLKKGWEAIALYPEQD